MIRRILGVCLLVAAAMLVLPTLFQGRGRVPDVPSLNIPPAPSSIAQPNLPEARIEPLALEEAFTPLPESGAATLKAQPSATAATQASPAPVASPSPASTVQNQPAPALAWSLQLASFSQSANADRMVAQLRDEGYNVWQREQATRTGGSLFQVFVGPFADEPQARQAQQALAELLSLEPLVVRYRP